MNVKKHNWIRGIAFRDECSDCGMISFIKDNQRYINMELNGIGNYEEIPTCDEFKMIVINLGLKKNCHGSFLDINCSDECVNIENVDFKHVEKNNG